MIYEEAVVNGEITQAGLDYISNLCNIVYSRHFDFYDDKEDLIQEGMIKSIELLYNGNYNPDYSLKNYLYTGIRNTMKNFIYHNSKSVPVEDVILDIVDSKMNPHELKNIDLDFDKFKEDNPYLSFNDSKVRSTLKFLGFNIRSEESVLYKEVLNIVCLVIWKTLPL
nr:MAG TPA: RNA polymerase sigma factor [Caudoviricetes sp.]